jgi:cytochrome c oxidase subunit 4
MTAHAATIEANGERIAPEYVVPVRVYLTIFTILMILTGVTVGVSFIDLGAMNSVIAVVIAVVKMLLVVLYFMHVRYSTRLTWAVVAGGFFWLLLLLGLTLADYLTRGPGWLHYG